MVEDADGGGRFSRGRAAAGDHAGAGADLAAARALHGEAHAKCFIANSVNFPIRREPVFLAAG